MKDLENLSNVKFTLSFRISNILVLLIFTFVPQLFGDFLLGEFIWCKFYEKIIYWVIINLSNYK